MEEWVKIENEWKSRIDIIVKAVFPDDTQFYERNALTKVLEDYTELVRTTSHKKGWEAGRLDAQSIKL